MYVKGLMGDDGDGCIAWLEYKGGGIEGELEIEYLSMRELAGREMEGKFEQA